ncbi:MAG: hydroxymethylbilane synthase [Phycisphaerae bacterium]
MKTIRIGTRASSLAQAQSAIVASALEKGCDVKCELVPIITSGDRRHGPLAAVGGKGLFTAELEAALRAGTIQFAVHSAKDLPAVMGEDLTIAAVPPREDPRDALVSPSGGGVEALPRGATVGTGSPRRAAQLLAIRVDLRVRPVRGNVETRVARALGSAGRHPPVDAVVLAMAGLNRSGLSAKHAANIHPLELDAFIPAAGQGALAVQCMAGDAESIAMGKAIDHADSHAALISERMVAAGLAADCRSCLAVHVRHTGDLWLALGMAARPDGTDMLRVQARGPTAQAAGSEILAQFKARMPPSYWRLTNDD